MNNQTLNQVIQNLLKEKKERSLPGMDGYNKGVSVGVGIAIEKVEEAKKRLIEEIEELERWQKQYPYKNEYSDKIRTLKWVIGEIAENPASFKTQPTDSRQARLDAAPART